MYLLIINYSNIDSLWMTELLQVAGSKFLRNYSFDKSQEAEALKNEDKLSIFLNFTTLTFAH